MRDSIFYSAIRALVVACFTIIGICLGFFFLFTAIGYFSTKSDDDKLTQVNTEEILPDADGERIVTSADSPVILQINIDQEIGTAALNAKTIRQILVESREGRFKNNRVKGIFLYIDSPGGSAIDSDIIFRALLDYKKKYNIPVYAFVDGLCASGAFYIALAADKIFSNEVGIIGSVGVIASPFMNFSKLMDKIGVDSLTVSSGKGKDAMNPLRPWKENEDQNYREITDHYYDVFVNLVTAHRPIDKEKLVNEYGADVFTAPGALKRGYIDTDASSLQDALRELVKKADLEGESYQVVRLENKDWWKSIFSGETSMLFSGKIRHEIALPPKMDLFMKHQYLYLYYPQ